MKSRSSRQSTLKPLCLCIGRQHNAALGPAIAQGAEHSILYLVKAELARPP